MQKKFDKSSNYSISIRPMTEEERQRAKEKETYNTVNFNLCVSCGCPTPNTWCEFCLKEE
tara:strand:+ start:443 stop:622 length:180 start_codon:yes stop_codon:yes gene_type:complete